MLKQRITRSIEKPSLKERLSRRMAVEAEWASARHISGNCPLLLRADRITKPLLKYGLQLTGLYSRGVQNALRPVVRKLRLHFPGLPSAFDGFQVLHLSDLHIDGMDGLAEALSGMLGELEPDLCVMTGDYRFAIEGTCEWIYPRMRSILSSVRAKYGVYGILGNHDPCEVAFGLEALGVNMLVNEAAKITKSNGSVWLAGVDDPYDYRCHDLKSALDPVPADGFKILLAHTPELYGESADRGVHLYLCGHTHAGQVRLPWIGPVLQNADCPRSYAHGHWRHGEMHGYTSAGIGCSMLPIRFNCPPEIVLIELASSPA
jgi:predicted MPP superfamily phosphohydrolase